MGIFALVNFSDIAVKKKKSQHIATCEDKKTGKKKKVIAPNITLISVDETDLMYQGTVLTNLPEAILIR